MVKCDQTWPVILVDAPPDRGWFSPFTITVAFTKPNILTSDNYHVGFFGGKRNLDDIFFARHSFEQVLPNHSETGW